VLAASRPGCQGVSARPRMNSATRRLGRRGAEAVHDRDDGFTAFFRTEYPALVRTLFLVVHERELARDIAQDAFVHLYPRWRRVSRYDRPDAWVRRVAVRMAVRASRREGCRSRLAAGLAGAPVTAP